MKECVFQSPHNQISEINDKIKVKNLIVFKNVIPITTFYIGCYKSPFDTFTFAEYFEVFSKSRQSLTNDNMRSFLYRVSLFG